MSAISKEQQKNFMALCIISVVCAHTHVTNGESIVLFNEMDRFLGNIGCVGVCGFFVLSGYTFSLDKRHTADFWKHKCNVLIIPWLCWSFIYYIVNYILHGRAFSLINIITGWAGSYYIYSLILLYVIFGVIRKTSYRIYISLISILITEVYCFYKPSWINPYFSLFPWLHWFAIGILLDRVVRWIDILTGARFYSRFGVALTLLANFLLMKPGLNYFSMYYMVVEVFNLVLIYWISSRLSNTGCIKTICSKIGGQTLWIMFTNFYVTIIFEKFLLLFKNGVLILFAPIMTVFFLVFLADVFKNIENRHKLPISISKVLGIR